MRIGLVIWSLRRIKGGIQRVGVDLAHAMLARGHECVLFHQDIGPNLLPPMYPVHPSIDLINLELNKVPASLVRARARLSARNLDVLCAMFSWQDLLWFPALMNGTGVPFLISEHSNPGIIEQERWNRYERIACMAGADVIHLLSASFIASLPGFLHERVAIIGNPALPPVPVDRTREEAPRKRLLAVGRHVDKVKQFSLLMQAFALLAPAFPDWDLHMCGDGEDTALYRQLATLLNVESRIVLHGRVDDMDAQYAAAHLFCIPSRFEGFGVVTLEAQRFALPVVGFAECSGVNEIVVHGESGLLAPEMTEQSLAACLRLLMKNPAMRQKMGARGQTMLARYAPERVYDQWENLFRRAQTAKGNTCLNVDIASDKERAEAALREVLFRRHPFERSHS